MGISGLLPLLKEVSVNGHISEFKGKKNGKQGYVWLHKGAFGCAEDLVKGKKSTKFVDYAMYRVRFLRHHGIEPFLVFDGGPLPAKKGTEVSRAKSRLENLEKARSLEAQGRIKEAKEAYTRCVDVTPEMAYQLIKALRAENVDYVVAPYEADAQLCFLEREGYVDGIITEDSDLLVFGCKRASRVIFKLDKDGQCVWIHRDRLAKVREFPMHGWTDMHFRRMAMLSGCDYLDSIPGIGIKTAHRLMRRFNSVEKLLQHIRLEGTYLIPPTYLSDFAQAELAFLYQRVYDPSLGRLVHLNPLPPTTTGFQLGEEGEKWVGVDVEEGLARRMARGDVHPETGLEIVDGWPELAGGSGGAGVVGEGGGIGGAVSSLGGKRQAKAHGVHGVHVQGPMDAFITRFKKPKHHHPKRDCPDYPTHANHEQQHIKSKLAPIHQPVGTYTSGASRLSDQLALRPLVENVIRDGEDGCMTENVKVMSKFFGGRGKKQIRKRQKDEEKNEDGGEGKIELEWEEEEEQEGDGPTHSRSRSLTPTSTPTRIRQRRRSPSPAISSLIASSPPAPPPPPPLPRMTSQSFPSPESFSPCPSPSLSPIISPSFSSCSRQRFMSQTQYVTSPPAAECSSPPVLDFPISSFAEEDKRKQGINVGPGTEMETETETKMFERDSSLGMVVSPTSSPTPPHPLSLSLSRSLPPTRVQSEEENENEEEERKEKAKMVGGSWRAKWAFGGGLEMKGTPKFGAGASAKRAQKQTPKTVPVQKKTSTLTRSSTLALSKRREAMSTGASSRVLKNRPVNVVRGEREALRSGLVTPTRAPSMASVLASSTTERNVMEMKMKVAVKQFGFGRAGRKASEVSGDKEKANTDSAVEEGEEEGEKEEEGEDIGSFTPSPERKPLFSRFSVGGSTPLPRSLPCRNSPNDKTTTFSHPFVSCSDLGSSGNDNLNITLKDIPQREKQGQKQAKQQTRPGLCFVRDRGGSDDVDENTYQQMNQPVRNKTPVSRTTLGRLERYRFEKVSVRK
ncbi:Exonuclease, putative [Cryptococcus gattii WM276]|uniref:Exonuclease, putative n=1 Tax=Cryptococcus gattii serotype B (strain WM276 / ATCC MYA-4071) TaxID=367775 RepID=E6R1I6_CRYGW|nr:Exonuclease, putative [Cryptococcus gattii WM276]ADV20650.1 Exonuclease, putative [Cryptococcus gattii WM276]